MGFWSRILGGVGGSEEAAPNPMQAAYDAALDASDGGQVTFSHVLEHAQILGIEPAAYSNLQGLKVQGLTFDEPGVNALGGEPINIAGMQAQSVHFNPYTTAAAIETRGSEAPRIGEMTFVGHAEQVRAQMPPIEYCSIGEVNFVSQDGSPPHNIAVSFENCSIGQINAQGGTHLSCTANNSYIADANFEGAKALSISVQGGAAHVNLDGASIAPSSQGMTNTELTGSMRGVGGYMSLEGSNCAGVDFTGTDISKFEMGGAPAAGGPSSDMAALASGTTDDLLAALGAAYSAAAPIRSACAGQVAGAEEGEALHLAQMNEVNQHRVEHDAPSRHA